MPVISWFCQRCNHTGPVGSTCICSPDPWVVVGRTTIDGTLAQVGGALLRSDGGSSTLRPDTIEDFVDERIKTGAPLIVGGRCLRLVGSHINSHTSTVLIRCDIVRRQSEIDAEKTATAFARLSDAIAGVEVEPCPECGPHGNRGKVMGLEQTYDCTTCAGGRSGDVWDAEVQEIEVKADDAWPASASGLSSYIEECCMRAAESLMLDRKVLFGDITEAVRRDPEVTTTYPTLGDVPYASDINSATFGGLLVNGKICLASGDIAEIRDGKVRSIIGRWA